MVVRDTVKRTGREPKQHRSRAKLGRILRATVELLATREFDDVSVAEIADAAGVSVGTIYTRFSDKRALLDHLIREMLCTQIDSFEDLFEEAKWTGVSLAGRVAYLIRLRVGAARAIPGVQRAVALREIAGGGFASLEEAEFRAVGDQVLHSWLLQCREEIADDDPETALEFALGLANWGIRGMVLFNRDITDLECADVADKLTRSTLAYLCQPVSVPQNIRQPHWPGTGFMEGMGEGATSS